MIKGTGIDIVDSRRIEKLVLKQDKAFDRLFTKAEQEKANGRQDPVLTYSKIFAAKEAFIKALGHSFDLKWTDISVLNNDLGKPYIDLSEDGLGILHKVHGENATVHLSLSDEPPYTIAFVVIEG